MKYLIFYVILVLGLTFQSCSNKNKTILAFDKLLVEYAENPIDLDVKNPRFSWIVSSEGRACKQTAFRIIVASTRQKVEKKIPDVWDSSKQMSAKTIHHAYDKAELKSNTKYYWKVIVWDENRKDHHSEITEFETAILNDEDWSSDWIGNGPVSETLPEKGFFTHKKEEAEMADTINHLGQSLLMRNEVELPKQIASAKAYISGLGFYEFFINGKRVGDRVLAPAKTPYHKHILYDTYDVTSLLQTGENALGIHLGNGWYNPYKPWWQQYRMQWFGSKKAMLQVQITYADGSTEIVNTNKDWLWADGPITYNCVYDGEVYDSNLENVGWTSTGFDASKWKAVNVVETPKARLVSHRMPAIKVNEIIQPKEVKVDIENMKVFDMGQNFTGWVRIKAKGEKHTHIKIRFAEDINEDGTIDRSSAEHAKAYAEYIMKGEGVEEYEPAFTYFGFKYVEVISDQPIELESIEGRVVYSDNKKVGNFECDNELVNKIHHATVWSQKSNMLGYPMDCPQRDERLGWFGDAQVSAEQAMFNFDMALHLENWFDGIKDNQDEKTGDIPIISPQPYILDEGVEWSSTYITMLWNYYTYYGDSRILKKHYPALKKYMEFLDHISKDKIVPKGWIGDWGSMTEGWTEGNPRSIPTAFYFFNSQILSKIAQIIGEDSDVKYYSDLAEEIKVAYNKEYLNAKTGNYLTGTQMDNAFPLFLGLVPEELKTKVLENLVTDIVKTNDKHLTTGVLGTKYMPEALAQFGKFNVVWDLINQKTYPSWNAMMEKYTTVCEFWTLKQSKNHVMMGSIDAWFYKYITGIQLDENNPAYTEFSVKPNLMAGLNFAKANLETIKGNIATSWKKEAGTLTLNVKVPFNTAANVSVPGDKNAECTENGISVKNVEGVEYIAYSNGAHQLKVQSGDYSFSIELN